MSVSPNPLASKKIDSIVTAAMYGKMETTNGIAPFIPSVKLSYTFTLLILATKKVARKIRGMSNAKIYFTSYIPP